MNQHDVHLLQRVSGYPAVTITLPTHRTSPDNKQDPIRVKNLVDQAIERLLREFNQRDLAPLLERFDRLVAEIDYTNALDGLALFVNRDISRAFYLPFDLPERVVVDESFFTRDLVYALNRTPRYWVLTLGEQPTRLYEAVREDLTEVTDVGFPLTHTGPGGAARLPGGRGVSRSAYRDEYHRQFFRRVDATLSALLAQDPLPVVVVGVNRFLAFYDEITANARHIVARVEGSHTATAPKELGELVWPPVKASLAAQRIERLDELGRAVGAQRSASTIGEVWRLAHDGRGELLLVEEDYHYPALVDETGRHLAPADDDTAPEVLDDAVDDVIETVLRQGGRVVFVDAGQLAEHGRIALVLRY
ncbi:MAG: hypothetical protein GXY68_00990 [Chloroflexi bacterium]|jgi:hypothetical protein|nr:hypothetical protein [Chloroflexota bacterium]